MAAKERAFEATDVRRPPELDVVDGSGEPFDLGRLSGQIVVLSFAPEGCGAPCAAQQALLARVREAVNVTPMRDMVTFVAVAEAGDGGEKPAASNLITVEASNDSTAASLAARFADLSSREGISPQAHVLDRGGRHAGIFHGEEFGYFNMVLYINGLSNARRPEPGLLDRVLGLIR
ncbi:cytochrome-c oxidase [Roseitranquillus sediminis]|uniref:cytochrome-c oxidase n=1 Tax=Roseitranquillus sediminis TaxID=2809051 RepID=UPI001D0C1ABA|nr:cytochrome-c oxidase [Roseitranquillus sediminis]MBM9595019.1 cytochrome-c oxidase [Roseitranquillus sediminis]